MSRLKLLLPMLALTLAGCASSQVDAPYEACAQNDGCSNGTGCIASTLPVATFQGFFCSTPCNSDNDCLQDLTNFAAICVNAACYIQCPASGNNCPYGTACVSFVDQDNFETDLCTP